MAKEITLRKRLTVYIGRFQPFHKGHEHILKQAIDSSDKVLVLVGSSFIARNIKNPFTFSERFDMINEWVVANYLQTAKWPIVQPLRDRPYNNAKWLQSVQEKVDAAIRELGWKTADVEVAITGSDRDHTTWYLSAFPQFITDFKAAVPPGEDLSATKLRKRLFEGELQRHNWNDVPGTTYIFLSKFVGSLEFAKLKDEYDFNIKYKNPHARLFKALSALIPDSVRDKFEDIFNSFVRSLYDPTFVTADACIIQSGHVLVVRRGALPGKGLIALPGGFVKRNQTLLIAAIVEAIEETGLKLADGKRWKEITTAILTGSLRAARNFDDPDRSLRGRTFTTCHLFRLDDTKPLPVVKGQFFPVEDIGAEGVVETEDAFWMPISYALAHPEIWFEDHHPMLETMIDMIND